MVEAGASPIARACGLPAALTPPSGRPPACGGSSGGSASWCSGGASVCRGGRGGSSPGRHLNLLFGTSPEWVVRGWPSCHRRRPCAAGGRLRGVRAAGLVLPVGDATCCALRTPPSSPRSPLVPLPLGRAACSRSISLAPRRVAQGARGARVSHASRHAVVWSTASLSLARAAASARSPATRRACALPCSLLAP